MEKMGRTKVVWVRGRTVYSPSGDIDLPTLRRMFERGICLLTGEADPGQGLRRFFSPEDRVGIKVNTIGGKNLSTRPEVSLLLASWLAEKTVRAGHILIWDRTNREMKDAGYRLSSSNGEVKVFGTDTDDMGYGRELVIHRRVGSLFSTLQERFATASISLAILKDHGLAGITAGMKNYFGAIHNPNKYHDDGCDPFVADVFDAAPIKTKHRLSVVDGLTVQYHKGPSFHPRWAEKCRSLILSADPVAADRVGWRIIEELRAKKDLPTLEEEGREPRYLQTAQGMGLGLSDIRNIEIIEERI